MAPHKLADEAARGASQQDTERGLPVIGIPPKFNGPRLWMCKRPGCIKSFSRKSDLVRHDHTHTGTRNHRCPFPDCGKTFIQTSALTVHKRTHTGEKPHGCVVCPKRFSDSSSLARHRKTHANDVAMVYSRETFCNDSHLEALVAYRQSTLHEAVMSPVSANSNEAGHGVNYNLCSDDASLAADLFMTETRPELQTNIATAAATLQQPLDNISLCTSTVPPSSQIWQFDSSTEATTSTSRDALLQQPLWSITADHTTAPRKLFSCDESEYATAIYEDEGNGNGNVLLPKQSYLRRGYEANKVTPSSYHHQEGWQVFDSLSARTRYEGSDAVHSRGHSQLGVRGREPLIAQEATYDRTHAGPVELGDRCFHHNDGVAYTLDSSGSVDNAVLQGPALGQTSPEWPFQMPVTHFNVS